MTENPRFLVVIAGPTASGKTDLAISMASFFSTEILSADSRQFYHEMNIGTARPTPEQLAAAPHHFIDFLPLDRQYSAGDFELDALRLMNELFVSHSMLILCGGSGLYIRAVCEGFDDFPPVPAAVRSQLQSEFEAGGVEFLRNELQQRDPAYFIEVDTSNPRRMLRALEVIRVTGLPFSSFRAGSRSSRPFQTIKIGLDLPRQELYSRINNRVDLMMEKGLLQEAEKLFPLRHLNSLQTVGYRELFNYMEGRCSLGEAVEEIKKNTRRYAKRQLTWFRADPGYTWFHPDDAEQIREHLIRCMKIPS